MANAAFNEITIEIVWEFADSTYTPNTMSNLGYAPFNQRADTCLLSNSDSIAHVVNVGIQNSGTLLVLASVNVPAGTGVGGVAPLDAVALQANPAIGGFLCPATYGYGWSFETAINSPNHVGVVFIGGRVV